MKRLLAMALLAVIAAAPAARAEDGSKYAAITANPKVLSVGERGTWVASKHGDWDAGTLSIYIVGTVSDPVYSTLQAATCREYHTRQSYRLECDSPAGTDLISVQATIVIAPEYLHSVVCADDGADTYMDDAWQIITGLDQLYIPLLIR